MDIALLMKMQRSSVYAVFECWPIKKHAMQCVADLMVNLKRLMQQAACTGANACHNPQIGLRNAILTFYQTAQMCHLSMLPAWNLCSINLRKFYKWKGTKSISNIWPLISCQL